MVSVPDLEPQSSEHTPNVLDQFGADACTQCVTFGCIVDDGGKVLESGMAVKELGRHSYISGPDSASLGIIAVK